MVRYISKFLFCGITFLLLNQGTTHAQDIQKHLQLHKAASWYQLLQTDNPNYHEVTDAFEVYFKQNEYVKTDAVRAYIRWTRGVSGNYDAKGNLLTLSPKPKDLEILKRTTSLKSTSNSGSWQQIGPFTFDLEARYRTNTQGVVRCIEQDPNNATKVLMGCIKGGVWFSTNSGDNWTNVTKDLLVSTVAGICIAPTNTNIAYASTKEGVIKSTDGGLTWGFTALDDRVNYPNGDDPTAIAIAHDDENKVISTTKKGLWVTIDGGANWTKKFSTHVYDVEFHPTNSDIAYATVDENTWAKFYKTTDGGASWTSITNNYPTPISGHEMRRSLIEVSPAQPNAVWVVSGGSIGAEQGVYGVLKSTDSGDSFTNIYQAVPGIAGKPNFLARATDGLASEVGQLSWDMAFAVSETNPDYMVAGTINVWKSTDGGLTWNYIQRSSSGTTMYHMDVQCAEIYDKNTWIGTDGGIGLSTDALSNLNDKSFGGFAAQQVWGLDRSWKSELMNAGLYHGQIIMRDDNTYVGGWYNIMGADASSTYINYGDDRYMYGNSYGGRRVIRSTDRYTAAKSDLMTVNTPKSYQQNEMLNHFYYGLNYTHTDNVFKQSSDEDAMGEWNVLSTFTRNLTYIHPSFAHSRVLFVVEKNKTLWRSTDGGNNWINRTPPTSLTGGYSLGNITSDGYNPDIIWCSIKGKQNQAKVLKSIDGGINWIDYSGPINNLPSYEVLSLAHQLGTDGGVYLGNSAGIWYRNNTMDEWVNFSNGLPAATPVTHIRFKYSEGKITIGSLRSIFEGDVYEASKPIAHPMTAQKLNATGTIKFVDHSVAASDASYSWSFPGGSPSTSTDMNPLIEYTQPGDYSVSLSITDKNGSSTTNYDQFISVQEPVSIPLDAAYNFNMQADDMTGNGWHASTDGITFANDVEKGQVATFNNSYSTISGHPGFDGTKARTITAWIKTSTADKAICGFGANETGEKWSFRLFSNGKLRVEVNGGYLYGSTLLTDGKWHHVACTFEDDGTPDVTDTKLYVDGKLETIASQQSQAINTGVCDKVWIAKDFGANRNFVGSMDDFYLFDYALSANEISQLYDTATGVENEVGAYIQISSKNKALTIRNSGETVNIKLFDMAGVCHNNFKMPNGSKTIVLPKTGIYVVAIYGDNQIQTKKVLVSE